MTNSNVSAPVSPQVAKLIKLAEKSERVSEINASNDSEAAEIKISNNDQLIVVEKFVESFKSSINQLTTSEGKIAPAYMLNEASQSNLREVCLEMNDYFNRGRHGHRPNLYEISYMFATDFIEAYQYTIPVSFTKLPEVGTKEYIEKNYDIRYNPKKAKILGNDQPGDGWKYRGRGLVQLTGKGNYRKMKIGLNIDYISSPDLALEFKHSVPIMIFGMKEGVFTNEFRDGNFTGKKLSDYINSSSIDYIKARRIINGNNKATIVAGNAKVIQIWLEDTSPNIPKVFQ